MKPAVLLAFASLCALHTVVANGDDNHLERRQRTPPTLPPPLDPTTTVPQEPTTTEPTTTTPTTTSAPTTTEPSTTTTPTTTQPTTTTTPTTTPNGPATTPPPENPATNVPNTSPTPTLTTQLSTDSAGAVVTVTVSQSSSSPSPSPTGDSEDSNAPSKPLGTGSIVGMAVAGGLAVVGIIGFIVWKITRKRAGDFDDNEAIKWPELNRGATDPGAAAGLGAPTRPYGDSDAASSRAPSESTQYLYENHDPYAVPALPHMNPNQPYRDDPSAGAAYYDPYNGPVPTSLHDQGGHEAIPMNQMAGRMSPGPGMAYDHSGRMSPGPAMAYDHPGSMSPGPGAGGYGVGQRTMSPAPMSVYGTGRASPGPHAAYGGPDPYGGR